MRGTSSWRHNQVRAPAADLEANPSSSQSAAALRYSVVTEVVFQADSVQLQCGIAGELAEALQPSTFAHVKPDVLTLTNVMLWHLKDLSQCSVAGVVHIMTSTSW